MSIDHEQRAREAYSILIMAAYKRRTITYKKLANKLGLHHRSARWFLDVIQRYCGTNDLPPLQALVVRKSDKVPGSGYRGSGVEENQHKDALERVFEHDWPPMCPF